MGAQTGMVALNGVGGSIVVEGQLSAPGIAPGTMGGDIEVVTTGNVTVASDRADQRLTARPAAAWSRSARRWRAPRAAQVSRRRGPRRTR